MQVVSVGPYVGNFENEILHFRPYVMWLAANLKYDKFVVSTHNNRQFLYNNIKKLELFPIDDSLSLSENRQIGYLNTNLTKKEYITYSKGLKDLVAKTLNISKREIKTFPMTYSQNQTFSALQKHNIKIIPPKDTKDIKKRATDCILFIPASSETEERNKEMYNNLRKLGDVIVAGDTTTNIKDKNIILRRPDYNNAVYKCIIKWMNECSFMVCPSSFWTFLGQQQNIPFFSWGNVSQYKQNNDLGCLLASDNSIQIEKIFKHLVWFLKEKNIKC